jgi:hypothetical protein
MNEKHMTDGAANIKDDARNSSLDADFQHLRHAMRNVNTPHLIEAALLKKFAAQARASRHADVRQKFGAWIAPGAAIAASLGMAAWMTLTTITAPVVQNNTNTISRSAENDAPFVALQSLEQIALEPNPRVIETQIPKMMLTTMGVAVPPDVAGDMLRTEMLVSASGQPLALRFSSNY